MVIVGSDGRAKAYRPLPEAQRHQAIAAGLAAYDRGDFFEAHEELEPAWMGSENPAERAWLQGLIKVAAAYVHDVRGNPAGIERNLTGARRLLGEALAGGQTRNTAGVDLISLLADVDARLADLAVHPDAPTLEAPTIHRMPRQP
jgi:predicted metal-dependent hydrolase